MDDISIRLRFYDMRGWRIVEAPDSDNIVRRGIFIPFIHNGIDENDGKPVVTFIAKRMYVPNFGRATHHFSPYISSKIHEEMVKAGVLSEEDKVWAPFVGCLYKPKYAMKKKGA